MICYIVFNKLDLRGHAFTGVWIETQMPGKDVMALSVTPSRACGLKLLYSIGYNNLLKSRLHGRVD